MPKTKFQNVVFTIIMAAIMVYGMIVYNVSLNTGGMRSENFLLALHEMPMALIWQLLYCGPLVRLIFRTIFPSAKQ